MASIPDPARGMASETLQASPVPSSWPQSPRSWYLNHVASSGTPSSSSSMIHPYWLAHSSFIGPGMASHLMRRKKPLAIGVKFRQSVAARTNASLGDAITNMEGALHTFVMPVVRTVIHGDYQYRYGHGICEFGSTQDEAEGNGGFELAREVLISGLVHLDFELENVMWEFVRNDGLDALLEDGSGDRVEPTDSVPQAIDAASIISVAEKQSQTARTAYDASIRRRARLHLLHAQGANIESFIRSAKDETTHITMKEAVDLLVTGIRTCCASESMLTSPNSSSTSNSIISAVTNKWLLIAPNSHARLQRRFARDKLSLHLLFLTMLHQVRNEHALLDHVVEDIHSTGVKTSAKDLSTNGEEKQDQPGYVYTYDPPQIFRSALGEEGKELLTALHAAALRHLVVNQRATNPSSSPTSPANDSDPSCIFAHHMRVFAYNDFSNPLAMEVMRLAFRERLIPEPASKPNPPNSITVMRKADLFAPEPRAESGSDSGLYRPPDYIKGKWYWLVLHNNSDGFGNNVENESGMGSMDAVLGEYSGMAASLRLHDPDLGWEGDEQGEDGEEGGVRAKGGERQRRRRREREKEREREREKEVAGGEAGEGRRKKRLLVLSDESLGLGAGTQVL